MSDLQWDTKITEIDRTRINIRGYPVGELMGSISFAQAVWLVLMGEIPDEKTTRLLDAILVSSVDHSAAPPSTIIARTSASTGASLSASVAAGILGMNEFAGGAIEGCFRALDEAVKKAKRTKKPFDETASVLITEYKLKNKFVPGFGHKLHVTDPRSVRLFEIAEELGLARDHIKMAIAFEKAFAESEKNLPLNINGAMGAVLGDLGVPAEIMNGFFMIARLPGLVAHVHEESMSMPKNRKIHPTEFGYSGPSERHKGK